VMLRELAAIAPRYQGSAALPNQETEFATIKTIRGFREVPGTFMGMKALLQDPPEGIVHFAGHGLVETVDGAQTFVIQLEQNITLSLAEWTGLVHQAANKHSLYFLNACDVGQTEQVANFVYGWGPTVLESGGSGFIGGMWPLSDKGASDFASVFYNSLREGAKAGSVEVAELLRLARRKFAETGDPTYLGYVFYGDVGLKLVP
jgi:CHAT domain-containing protein